MHALGCNEIMEGGCWRQERLWKLLLLLTQSVKMCPAIDSRHYCLVWMLPWGGEDVRGVAGQLIGDRGICALIPGEGENCISGLLSGSVLMVGLLVALPFFSTFFFYLFRRFTSTSVTLFYVSALCLCCLYYSLRTSLGILFIPNCILGCFHPLIVALHPLI
jgi:hypothetical protein